jgi:hypothetical protein
MTRGVLELDPAHLIDPLGPQVPQYLRGEPVAGLGLEFGEQVKRKLPRRLSRFRPLTCVFAFSQVVLVDTKMLDFGWVIC